jgi:DNA-directed RNA polymerase specialized sigma subunit
MAASSAGSSLRPALQRANTVTLHQERPHSASASKMTELSLSELRKKVRSNRVSFPSQVPTFPKHDRPDLQRKAVQLYFLFGWSCSRIAQRYGILRQRIQQILSTWKRRAIQMGYIQEIPPAKTFRAFAKLVQ